MSLRWLVVICVAVLIAGCDQHVTAPTVESFPLPADAPAQAAAPEGTTRVAITAFDTSERVALSALHPNASYHLRVWLFCPRGLEGSFDYRVTGNGGQFGGSGEPLPAGYTKVELPVVFLLPDSYPFTVDIIRSFVTVASRTVTLTVDERIGTR